MTGGRPTPKPAVPPAAAPAPVPPARAPRIPIAFLVIGALIFGYGMVLQSPMSPSAVWSGVLDSTRVVPSSAPAGFGRHTPTRAVTLYLRKVSSERTFRLPPAYATLADSLQHDDTVQAILGWYSAQDTATALRLTRNGAMLLDSGVVLSGQRRQRSRTGLGGAVLMLIGIVGLMRRPRVPAA